MANPTTQGLFQSNLSWIALLTAFVTLIALIFAAPQPPWDWDRDVLQLASQYTAANKKISREGKNQEASPLQGVVAVITGATSGIGLGLTKVLTRLGAHVVVVGRSPTKLQQLVHDLKQQQPNVKITTVVGDLEDLASVAQAAVQITSTFPRIDILINNAGLNRALNLFDRSVTPQGYDVVFGVNYLSHVLLTEKLLPNILKSSKPRIVQISSTYHIASDGSNLVPQRSGGRPIASQPGGSLGFYIYRTQRQYADSKLAQILHARSLQRRYPTIRKRNSTWIRSACPAWVGTNIGGQPGSLIHSIVNRFGFSIEGWGLASILQAIFFDENIGNSGSESISKNQKSATLTNDFFVNTYWTVWFSRLFLNLDFILGQPLVYKSGLRDCIANAAANMMLFTQKLLPFSGPSPSSPESYNIDLQDQLYQWSREAVSPWI